MIVGRDPAADRGVELGERESWRARRARAGRRQVAGQPGQQLGRDRAEEALDLAAALRHAGGGVDQLDAQVRGDLLEVVAREVRAVVAVEDLGQPADRPGRVGLAPDRLAQRQRGLQRRGRAEVDGVAGDRAAEVIEDRRQPRPRRAARVVEDHHVELGVVGLPDRVGCRGLAAKDQLEAVAVARRPVVRERHEPGIERDDDRAHRPVAGWRPATLTGHADRLAVDVRRRAARAPQRQPLDERHELRRLAADVAVTPRHPRQTRQPGGSVTRQPMAGRARRDPGRCCRVRQRDAVLEVRAQHLKAPLRLVALLLGELAQRDHVACLQAAAASPAAGGLSGGARWR